MGMEEQDMRRHAFGALTAILAFGCGPRGVEPDVAEPEPEPDASSATDEAGRVEYWRGEIDAGPMKLGFRVTLRRGADGAWAGALDIPMQQVAGAALADVSRDATSLRFVFAAAGAAVELTVDGDGRRGTGVLRQGGAEFPATAVRVDTAAEQQAGPARPQTPTPPFPYASRDVTFATDDGGVLAGTLTVPEGDGPHPAVVFITGSGAQDRDETLFDHKPFLVIADALTRGGIATLRVDDRGVGGSTADPGALTMDVRAADTRATIAFAAAQPEVDAARVGLVGHSEGGIVAPMVAARDDGGGVAFIVALAPSGVRGEALIPMQLGAILRASGVADEGVARLVAAQAEITRLVAAGTDGSALRATVRAAIALNQTIVRPDAPLTDAALDGHAGQAVATLTSPMMRSFIASDPAVAWRRVRVPALALIGERDLQVPHAENLAAIRAALTDDNRANVELRSVAGLNHLFQRAETGLVEEYAQLEETFDPTTLEAVVTWVRAKTGLGGTGMGAGTETGTSAETETGAPLEP